MQISATIKQSFPKEVTKANNKWLFRLAVLYLVYNYTKPILDILSNYNPLTLYFGRIVGVLLIIQLIFDKKFWSFLQTEKRYVVYIYLFITVVFISLPFIPNIYIFFTANRLYEIFSCWILYMIFMYLSLRDDNGKNFLWLLTGLAILNALVGLYGSLTGQSLLGITRQEVGVGAFGYDPTTGRSGGLRGENYVGIWNAPALAVGFLLLFSKKYKNKALGMAFVIVSSLSTIISLSRTSLLCAIIVTILALFFLVRNNSYLLVFLFVSLLIFVFSQPLIIKQSSFFSHSVRSDMEKRWSISNMIEDERIYIWDEYLKISIKKPIFGHGAGYIEQEISRGNTVPHNSLLDVFVEHGFSGLLLYVIPFILAVRSIIYFKNRKCQEIYGVFFCITFFGMAAGLLTLSNPFLKLVWMVAGSLEGRTILARRAYKRIKYS